MAFVVLNDGINTLDGVMFPDTFKRFETDLADGATYVVRGKFEQRNNKRQLIIQHIESIEHFESEKLNHAQQIVIRNVDDLTDIQQILSQTEHNQIPVNYYDESTKQLKQLDIFLLKTTKLHCC